MRTRFTRRQFFIGVGALMSLAAAPKPCWELPPNNPNWCPPPAVSPTGPRLLLLFK